MLVKHLIKYLQEMDPESVVGFIGNGTWNITGMSYGKVKGKDRGYVLLAHYDGVVPTDPGKPPVKE